MEKATITSMCWVPCGEIRTRFDGEGDDEDLPDAEAAEGGAAGSSAAAKGSTAGLEEFDMDNYDDADEDGGMQLFTVLKGDMKLANQKDPYLHGNPEDSDEEESDFEIGAEDKVFIAVTCDEEECGLELYVYNEEEASMYVHHDIMLGAYPLCVEWLNCAAGIGEGSFAAVGLIDHSIQIWDLSVIDVMEPAQVLGPKKKAKAKAKRRRAPPASDEGVKAHDGPVLALHGNTFSRSVLASGGADETVKVWDVSAGSCVHVYEHHSNKVQCVRWHPTEQAILLSAAFDGKLGLLDVRQPGQVAMAPLPAEAECGIWSRHRQFECLVSVDNGGLSCFDVRKVAAKVPEQEMVLWSLQAYDVACTSVQDCLAPDCLMTTGLDGVAKVWNSPGTTPKMVLKKNLQAGPLFTCQSSLDSPGLFSFGGKCPVMWDLTSEELLTGVFKFEESA